MLSSILPMDKSEIRKSIFHSSGCDADDWLEGAKRSGYAFEGARKALKKAAQESLSIALVVKKDLEEGKLDGMDASAVADYAILQVTRAHDSLIVGSQHYENRQLATQGETAAYERIVKHFKALHDREEAKIQSRLEAEETGDVVLGEDGEPVKQAGRAGGRVTGVRPASGLAAQRRAEAELEEPESDKEVLPPTPEVAKPKKQSKSKKDGK